MKDDEPAGSEWQETHAGENRVDETIEQLLEMEQGTS